MGEGLTINQDGTIMNFIEASLKYKQVTLSVLILVFAAGIYSLLNMPRREDPKVTIPAALVVAYYPGANSLQVEEQVTKKLEEYLFQFEEVRKEKTFSITMDGMVEVHIWLQDNVRKPDIFWSKLKHQLMLAKAIDLPQGVIGPVVNSDFGDCEAMIIGIESKGASMAELNEYTKKLEDKLVTIEAASKIKRIGEQKEQYLISYNSAKLSQYNISLQQVVKVLQSQNTINPTGEIKDAKSSTPLYTGGYYQNESDIKNQVVGASKTGAIVRLGDIATVTRNYAEPNSKITINGNPAMMLTLQMQEGNNIVKFGKKVDQVVKEMAGQLPGNVGLTTISNQPKLVNENISEFLREFLLAIIAVILVVFLLLPMSIAAVAATAIPVTISITFALLNIFGIELHQVSLASLVVVLGMVVDDAIVIADNYVSLLDKGHDRWTAAWRSATDLVVPVLTATITIIAAFVPIVILTGAIGEFIFALPITVAVALSSSFLVAMLLTPMLCYMFIRKGLYDKTPEKSKATKRRSILDRMQSAYNKSIDWCSRNPRITVTASLLTIVLAGLLFKVGVRHKFFPAAERNQFIVELRMPTGTKLEKTEEAIGRIEKRIQEDKRVITCATFIGRSAPRFYYNYSPEAPSSNFAQILINTADKKATRTLYKDLSRSVASMVPEAIPQVKLMQQGQPLHSPVEVRIIGDDLMQLKLIGSQVLDMVRNCKGSYLVRSDFQEDYYGYVIQLKDEAARLGFTTNSISQMVYAGFSGLPVSFIYEGDNKIELVLKLDENSRRDINDLENVYLESPVTGARIPLRQVAEIKPQWNTGRIMHRVGLRTLTVESETTDGVLASELLKEIRPKINGLKLPEGYRIEYGGEDANKKEVFGGMTVALIISLISIFIVLLFQFRNIKEVGLVMLTIPLSLFGAILGLVITGNDFGFTAFVGLISLSGIVVRNAIILIDHANELIATGMDIHTAAIEAGKRRLRPIFLTAMAAAIGVWPMILSGSPLWSPMASVIAFGVVWSMIISTLAIPVFYLTVIKPSDKKHFAENENQ
jgi:multidrug efflux pump subunit AcrB